MSHHLNSLKGVREETTIEDIKGDTELDSSSLDNACSQVFNRGDSKLWKAAGSKQQHPGKCCLRNPGTYVN